MAGRRDPWGLRLLPLSFHSCILCASAIHYFQVGLQAPGLEITKDWWGVEPEDGRVWGEEGVQ